MTRTIRIYNPTGSGYRDVTTDDNGVEIRDVHYGEDGVVRKIVERDPQSGDVTTTEYEEGRKRERTVRGADGAEKSRETFDDGGNVERRETIAGFTSTTWEFLYDKHGRIVRAQRTESGAIVESVEFEYDREGRLSRATLYRRSAGGLAPEAGVEFDENGEITDAHGDIETLLERIHHLLAVEYGEGNSHVTRDHTGNRIRVRHNRDGSYDVEVTDSQGRLVLREYYQSGRCYLADECPLRNVTSPTH